LRFGKDVIVPRVMALIPRLYGCGTQYARLHATVRLSPSGVGWINAVNLNCRKASCSKSFSSHLGIIGFKPKLRWKKIRKRQSFIPHKNKIVLTTVTNAKLAHDFYMHSKTGTYSQKRFIWVSSSSPSLSLIYDDRTNMNLRNDSPQRILFKNKKSRYLERFQLVRWRTALNS